MGGPRFVAGAGAAFGPSAPSDGSSSLCVHGPPGSIRWAELVCGRFSAAPTNSRRSGDTAPSYDSSVRRRTPRVHRNRRGTRTVVEGRASIVTSPGGTAAPGSWIHHVGVHQRRPGLGATPPRLRRDATAPRMRRRRASEETRRRRGWVSTAGQTCCPRTETPCSGLRGVVVLWTAERRT